MLAPSGVMPYFVGYTDEVEKVLFLRRFDVPFWVLAYVFGKDDNYWYRMENRFGCYEIVRTVVKDPEKLLLHLLADEKITWLNGEKVVVATTVGEDCILGVSIALNADEENLTEAHQHFKDEAQALKADYVPETVNADGWSATQRAWLWIGVWHVIALARAGRLDESRETCARMAGIIVRDRQIYEVYAPNGKPLSNFWYKSESPLTWNAGMIVCAYSVLDQLMKSKTGIISLVGNEKE